MRNGTLSYGELVSGGAIALVLTTALYFIGVDVGMRDAARSWVRNFRATYVNRHVEQRPSENPFFTLGYRGSRYHPIIDIAGTGASFPIKTDYFGFRNDYDAYFDKGDYKYVVMTGNSEAVGYFHQTTIAQHLERILTERTGQKYRVVNLARNSSSLANEISYFVHLGFALKPEAVISHSLTEDFFLSRRVPKPFATIGMLFAPLQYEWGRLVHPKDYNAALARTSIVAAPDNIVDTVIGNVRRYKSIAESSGARFIWGIQKFNSAAAIGSPTEEDWRLIGGYYRRLKTDKANAISDIDILDFNGDDRIEFGARDGIHTTDESAAHIAKRYADMVLAGRP